jgi:hypothetical protein
MYAAIPPLPPTPSWNDGYLSTGTTLPLPVHDMRRVPLQTTELKPGSLRLLTAGLRQHSHSWFQAPRDPWS